MESARQRTIRLDDDAAVTAARLIAKATPSRVPEIIEQRETDPRVRRALKDWLAKQGKAA